jgi:hypothetical protein
LEYSVLLGYSCLEYSVLEYPGLGEYDLPKYGLADSGLSDSGLPISGLPGKGAVAAFSSWVPDLGGVSCLNDSCLTGSSGSTDSCFAGSEATGSSTFGFITSSSERGRGGDSSARVRRRGFVSLTSSFAFSVSSRTAFAFALLTTFFSFFSSATFPFDGVFRAVAVWADFFDAVSSFVFAISSDSPQMMD